MIIQKKMYNMINIVFGKYLSFFIIFTQVVKILSDKYCMCESNKLVGMYIK